MSIESGSSDVDGLARIAALIADRLRALGGDVELVAPPADMIRVTSMPAQVATRSWRDSTAGHRRILLLAHMDTVYQRGMLAQQPFRIDGDRAYGLGIADDKHGVALILHALAIESLNVERLRPDHRPHQRRRGSQLRRLARTLITRLGAEHDLVLSFEGAGPGDAIRLATPGSPPCS